MLSEYRLKYNTTFKPNTQSFNTIEFVFSYDLSVAGSQFDFKIKNFTNLKHGFDDESGTLYAGNIDIDIIDFSRNNLNRLRNLIHAYNNSSPFNHASVFTLQILENNLPSFYAILDNIEDFWDSELLTVSFVSFSSLLKRISFRNPVNINSFTQANLGKWSYQSIPLINQSQNLIFYGINQLTGALNNNNEWHINSVITDDQQNISNYNIFSIIHNLLKIYSPSITIELKSGLSFGNNYVNSQLLTQLYLAYEADNGFAPNGIYNVFGRYMLFKSPGTWSPHNIYDFFDYIGKFNFLSDSYELWVYKYDKGLFSDFSLNTILREIANSFGCWLGFDDLKYAFLIQEDYIGYFQDISRYTKKCSRQLADLQYSKVIVNASTSQSSEKGDGDSSKSVNAVFESNRNGIINSGNLCVRHWNVASWSYNPVTLVNNKFTPLSAEVADILWRNANNKALLKYKLEVFGKFSPFLTMRLAYNNELIYLKPISTEYDYISQISQVTALQIKHN